MSQDIANGKYVEMMQAFFQKEQPESVKARFYSWLLNERDYEQKECAMYSLFESYADDQQDEVEVKSEQEQQDRAFREICSRIEDLTSEDCED